MAAVAALIAVVVGTALFRPATQSTVSISNVGDAAAELVVTTVNPAFEWRGRLEPGQTVRRTTAFGDNSIAVTCIDALGSSNNEGGYVTAGIAFEVRVVVDSCDHVVIDTPSAP